MIGPAKASNKTDTASGQRDAFEENIVDEFNLVDKNLYLFLRISEECGIIEVTEYSTE